MKQFAKYVLATITGLFLCLIVLFIIIFSTVAAIGSSASKSTEVAENSILEISIKNNIVDRSNDNELAYLLAGGEDVSSTSLEDVKNALEKAKNDKNIKGIFLKIGFFEGGFASIQEMRQHILNFKKSGKFIYAHADVMDEKGYYLASAADSIYMNPAGDFFLNGFSSQVLYLKDAFDKIGVEMQAIRVGEYKSAVEPFISNSMSNENRAQVQAYLDELYNIFITETALSRNMGADSLKNMANNFTIQSGKIALEKGLVDGLFFMDEIKNQFAKRIKVTPKNLSIIKYKKYINNDNSSSNNKERIAVIYATGEIGMGQSANDGIGSISLSKTLEQVRKDDKIKAVVLRINSPGGSALASDIIWREVKLLQQKKPLIVSMGNVAASGGYYIAMPADTIVAMPSTITGSIGVFLLVPNAQKLMNDKLGIKFETVKTGEYADLGSIDRPLNTRERQILQGYANRVYADFLDRVAEGRKMDTASVDKVARGKVWVATQAKGANLVDVLGNLDTAISIAYWKANLKKSEADLDVFPKPGNPFERFLNMQSSIKVKAMEKELGSFYTYWKLISETAQTKGVQMRLPFEINF